MKIVIAHQRTKRVIEGPFNICAGREDFERLRDALNTWLEDDGAVYGWLEIKERIITPSEDDFTDYDTTKRQRHLPNTEVVPWSAP